MAGAVTTNRYEAPGGTRSGQDRGPCDVPELRGDLTVSRGATAPGGQPTWIITDPVRNRFISIDAPTYELVSLLPFVQSQAELASAVERLFNRRISAADIANFIRFLQIERLVLSRSTGSWKQLAAAERRAQPTILHHLVHDFIFFRIPLFNPHDVLVRTSGLVEPLFHRAFLYVTISCALVGLHLVSRQWDEFVASMRHFSDWNGAALFATALLLVKVLHELGHAYTAVRAGCRVSSIGVAFMMLMPMPYTDVSDAWRLRDRRQRWAIDSAGIKVELIVAVYAMLAWAFLPDGPWRSLAFALATTSFFMSVAVNLNPLMRFDGYYLLSDLLRLDNLQPRAFAVGRWRLRELLFGLGHPPPEPFTRRTLMALALYAYAVWAYRTVMVLAVAAVLIHFTFKLLGIMLLAIEIVLLIVKPVRSELKEWRAMKEPILNSRRTALSGGLAVLLLLGFVVPWNGTIVVPAVVELAKQEAVHGHRPARITQVYAEQGRSFSAGDVLVEMTSDDISQQLKIARLRLQLADTRLARLAGDGKDRAASLVLERERLALASEIEGLNEAARDLIIKAPATGKVLEIDAGIKPGRWINSNEPLLWFGEPGNYVAVGYVPIEAVGRIDRGARGRFIPDSSGGAAWQVTVDVIGSAGVEAVDLKALTSRYDGPLAVEPDSRGRLVPSSAQVRIAMRVELNGAEPPVAVRGVAHLEGRPMSYAERTWRQIVRVLVREAGT